MWDNHVVATPDAGPHGLEPIELFDVVIGTEENLAAWEQYLSWPSPEQRVRLHPDGTIEDLGRVQADVHPRLAGPSRSPPGCPVRVGASTRSWPAPRLRTRSRYARARVSDLVAAEFNLLPTFAAPHYSVLLPSYDEGSAQRLLDVLGEVQRNPFYVGRQP